MAKISMALAELVERGARDDVVRELLAQVAERLMEFEVEQRTGAEYGEGLPIPATAGTDTAIGSGKRAADQSTCASPSSVEVCTCRRSSSRVVSPRKHSWR